MMAWCEPCHASR